VVVYKIFHFSPRTFHFVTSLHPLPQRQNTKKNLQLPLRNFTFINEKPPKLTTSANTTIENAIFSKMSSTGFTELLHSIIIVFLWSAAVVVSVNFGVESVFSYNLSERTLWHILLLVFALLASFFVQLPGTDLTHGSTAGSVEAEDVVKQPSVTSTPICNHHEDNELEILALKSANDKLDAAVARERKRTANAESKAKLAEKKRDDLSYELHITKEKRHQDYLTHVDVSVPFHLSP